MTFELKPLFDDPNKPAYVRELLKQARSARRFEYDFDAALIKHQTLIASGAVTPAWAQTSLTGMAKTGVLIARIVGLVSVPVVGGLIAWNGFTASDPKTLPAETRPASRESIAHTLPAPSQPAPVNMVPSHLESHEAILPSTLLSPVAAKNKKLNSEFKKGSTLPSIRPLQPPSDKGKALAAETQPSTAVVETPLVEPDDPLPTHETDGVERVAVNPPMVNEFEAPLVPLKAKVKAAAPSDNALQREMVLLAEARRSITTYPSRALELAQTRQLRTGILNEEWDQVYLFALIKLGRIAEAKEGVKRFRSLYPNSAFNERLKKELLPSGD